MNTIHRILLSICFLSCVGSLSSQYVTPEGLVDLFVFSKDRIVQLEATLRSVKKYISGLRSITVFYHTKDDSFEYAYESLKKEYPEVRFVRQPRENRHAYFKSQVLAILEGLTAPYMMFAVDDNIVIDYVNCANCCRAMEKTKSYAFFLRLGRDLTHCDRKLPSKLPPMKQFGDNFYCWLFKEGTGYWAYPTTVDMTIYRRQEVLNYVRRTHGVSPNTFEGEWYHTTRLLPQATGLCYGTSRTVNIPLNLVQEGWDPSQPCRYSVEELLRMYECGMRIDIDKLHKVLHASAHADLEISWQVTEKNRLQKEEKHV